MQHDVSSQSIACTPYPDCQLKSRGFPRGPRQVLGQIPQILAVGSCDGWDIGDSGDIYDLDTYQIRAAGALGPSTDHVTQNNAF